MNKKIKSSNGDKAKWDSKKLQSEIVRKHLLSREERTEEMAEAINFAQQVARDLGLVESRGQEDSLLLTASKINSPLEAKKILADLDDESEIEEGDEFFLDNDSEDIR
jgi:hypothetical protein